MIRKMPLLSIVILLAGCTDPAPANKAPAPIPQEPPAPRTVLEFLENEAALEKTLAICLNDPGGVGRTPDCVNARQADQRLMFLGREQAIAGLKRKG